MLRPPEFWRDPDSLTAKLLTPLGCLFAAGGRLRQMTAVPRRAGIPVICVGNLVAGGAGKTPVALAVAERLAARRNASAIHFLTRGYGGSAHGPLRVDRAHHDASQVGDEALLLATVAPAWISRDRMAGAEAARDAGAACLILDDSFQNPALHKDLSLLVIDGGYGLGNGRVIPAGPLREPLADGLARAEAVVLIGEDRHGIAARLGDRPVLCAKLVPTAPSRAALAGRRVFAFAGIGRPAKFFDSLRELGCDLAATREFADHHPFTRGEIAELLAAAARLNALPVTTAKDAVRLPRETRGAVAVLDITLAWDDAPALDKLIDTHLTMPAS